MPASVIFFENRRFSENNLGMEAPPVCDNPFPHEIFRRSDYLNELAALAPKMQRQAVVEPLPENPDETYVSETYGAVSDVGDVAMKQVVSGLSGVADEIIWINGHGGVYGLGADGMEDHSEDPGRLAETLIGDLEKSSDFYGGVPISVRYETFMEGWKEFDAKNALEWARDAEREARRAHILSSPGAHCPVDVLERSNRKVFGDEFGKYELPAVVPEDEDLNAMRIGAWENRIADGVPGGLALPLTTTASNRRIIHALKRLSAKQLLSIHDETAGRRDAALTAATGSDDSGRETTLRTADRFEMGRRAIATAIVSYAPPGGRERALDWAVFFSMPLKSRAGMGLARHLRNDESGLMDDRSGSAKERMTAILDGFRKVSGEKLGARRISSGSFLWTNDSRDRLARAEFEENGSMSILWKSLQRDGRFVEGGFLRADPRTGDGVRNVLDLTSGIVEMMISGVWVGGDMVGVDPRLWGKGSETLEAAGYKYSGGCRTGRAGEEEAGSWSKNDRSVMER